MEVRLLRFTDLLPKCAVDRDHRIAENRLEFVEILHVVVDVIDEDAADVLDLAQDVDFFGSQIYGNAPSLPLLRRVSTAIGSSALMKGATLNQTLCSSPRVLRIGLRVARHALLLTFG